jgi:hypothetical protein
MKIAYFVIQILLIVMQTIICLQAKVDHSLYIGPNSKTSFLEMKTKSSNKHTSSTMKSLIRNQAEKKFKTQIIIFKQKDSLDDPPVEFEAQVEFGSEKLKVYINGELKKQLSYLE